MVKSKPDKANIVLIKPSVQRAFKKKDAALYLNISPSTLIKLSDAGEIPCYDLCGRRTYLIEDLDKWLVSKGWKVHHKEIPRGHFLEKNKPEPPKGA